MNSMTGVAKVHSSFSMRVCLVRTSNTLARRSSWAAGIAPWTTMSSRKTTTPGMAAKMVVIILWKQLGAELRPKGMWV